MFALIAYAVMLSGFIALAVGLLFGLRAAKVL